MRNSIRRLSVSTIAIVLCGVGVVPVTAQTQHDRTTMAVPGLSQALVEAPEREVLGSVPFPGEPRRSLVREIAGDFGRLVTTRGSYVALGAGLGSSLGVSGLDERIRDSRFNSELWLNEGTALDHVFEPGSVVGGALVQIGGAFATYGIGSLMGKPGVSNVGRDLVRVQLLTQGITQLVKRAGRRTRPDGSSRLSFPSGHASATFASATVLQRHYGWKAGIPAFGVASCVAASRLAENKHFLSDVVFGAAIGLTAGRTVTFARERTRLELSPMAAPRGAGIQLAVLTSP